MPCSPGSPPLITGDSAGSMAMILISGHFSFKYLPVPINVPPVPVPKIKASGTNLSDMDSKISGPVVS